MLKQIYVHRVVAAVSSAAETYCKCQCTPLRLPQKRRNELTSAVTHHNHSKIWQARGLGACKSVMLTNAYSE